MKAAHIFSIAAAIWFVQGSLGPAAMAATSIKEKAGRIERGLRPAIRKGGEKPIRWTIEERMAHYGVPGVSIALIESGRIAWAKGYGVREAGTKDAVDTQTVFSVGSLSKVSTAVATLRLVADGVLDLDTDVNSNMTQWQVPQSDIADGRPVTLRGIMSHSAGLSVRGFEDFLPNERLPTVVETLNGTPPANNAPVRIFYKPGAASAYSGGGTTVEQLVITDTTGLSFAEAARRLVLKPLGMTRSTYENPLPPEHGNIAHAHDANGAQTALPRGWHTFPEMAASGLWTTPTDYARMLIALTRSYHGAKDAFLPQSLAIDALTEQGPSAYGLGPHLDCTGFDRRFMHGGSNDHYKAHFEIHPERGDGIVIFTNGARGELLYQEILGAASDALDWPYYRELATLRIGQMPKRLDQFVGTYVATEPETISAKRVLFSPSPPRLNVRRDEDGLYLAQGSQRVRLLPIAPTVYTNQRGNPRYEFVAGVFGSPSRLVIHEGLYAAEFERAGATAANLLPPISADPVVVHAESNQIHVRKIRESENAGAYR